MIKRFSQFGVGMMALAIACLVSLPVSAVESFGVGARPANPRADNPRTQSIFVYDLAPGATVSDTLLVVNNAQQKKVVNVYGVDSQNSSDGAFACAQAADVKKAVGSWINLEQSQVTLDPGQQTKIPFTLTVPKNADVGEHNGCIAVQAVDAVTGRDQNGISLSFRSALRVAVTIPGMLTSDLKLDSAKHDIKNNTLTITPTFKNTGNVSVDAQIAAQIDSLFGQTIATTHGTFPVLRDALATFNFETARPFWGGYYKLAVSADYKPLSGNGASRHTNEVSTIVFIEPDPVALVVELTAIGLVIGGTSWVIWRKRRHAKHVSLSHHHTVKAGEDIESIGADYSVSWKLVARVNKLKPPYTVKPGEKLLIPGGRHAHKPK